MKSLAWPNRFQPVPPRISIGNVAYLFSFGPAEKSLSLQLAENRCTTVDCSKWTVVLCEYDGYADATNCIPFIRIFVLFSLDKKTG